MQSTIIRMYYYTTTVEHHYEYPLVDFATLVGSVGGALGLFLGISCFAFGKAFGNALLKLIFYVSSNWDHEKDKKTIDSAEEQKIPLNCGANGSAAGDNATS